MESVEQTGEAFGPEVLAGNSPAAERLRLQVARFAPHFRTMLLVGEAGTGKQTVARALHRLSPVAGLPFRDMAIETFAAGEGEAGGLMYLRGLGGMRIKSHDGLLRRLTAVGRETRVVVACEGEPRGMVSAGRLRTEVLERVGVLEMRVAPLRERRGDLAEAIGNMLCRLGCAAEPAQLGEMLRHDWPGNFAELWRVCLGFAEHGVVRLEDAVQVESEGLVRLEEVIERHVMEVLERCAGNKLKAAELLGISRSTLYRMLDGAAGLGAR